MKKASLLILTVVVGVLTIACEPSERRTTEQRTTTRPEDRTRTNERTTTTERQRSAQNISEKVSNQLIQKA
jgi:hypothetical protein